MSDPLPADVLPFSLSESASPLVYASSPASYSYAASHELDGLSVKPIAPPPVKASLTDGAEVCRILNETVELVKEDWHRSR